VSAAYRQQQDDVSATRARLERLAKEKEEIRRGEVVSALFDPLQNLRRAKDGMDKSDVDTAHTHGVELVIKQILSAFENLGMEEVPGKGSKFDPNLHEALTMMPVQDPALHEVVIEVFESGYRIGSRLIRPARVILGSYTAPEESPEAPEPVEA
jgi:molecular chaperone GrpE (heat shock protein)